MATLGGLGACAPRRAPEVTARAANEPAPRSVVPSPAIPESDTELAAAIESLVTDLKARGGDCEEFGAVLENALATGHIRIRPYMWRVEGNLASAQGESSGELTIARDIDALNVGVRRLDDVLRSAEHEAAHIALRIPSGDASREAKVDERVNSCRSGGPR